VSRVPEMALELFQDEFPQRTRFHSRYASLKP
jgi:hypothetical protein